MADLVERAHDQMSERIAQLRPAVEELRWLEVVVAALGESVATGDGARSTTETPAPLRWRGRPKGSGRTRGARSTQVKG